LLVFSSIVPGADIYVPLELFHLSVAELAESDIIEPMIVQNAGYVKKFAPLKKPMSGVERMNVIFAIVA
jgi:hypothetical protein